MISTLPIRVNTVVIRKLPDGTVRVMLFTGQKNYVPARNSEVVVPLAREVVRDYPAGDYDCPLDLAANAVF
jgi:hypothetical protein